MINRREFFGAATAAAVPVPEVRIEHPKKAFVVMALNWMFNDEMHWPDGEYLATSQVFYDKAEAQKVADELCKGFFELDTPREFQVDTESFEEWSEEDDRRLYADEMTWDELVEKGFPLPYFVAELDAATTQKLQDEPSPGT